ncbi:hypothetical protein O6H91_16G036300 [Diphasiastrum complanatum]|uniref:Uncharacterized protein n=1 Tax=Diphasiastrum complanatum TaxID=34168 RepID=A0ACC2BBH4_DIPCM|nr:hypothetical protein O6H91_16G036300 [Diphasiastrum complanatum]
MVQSHSTLLRFTPYKSSLLPKIPMRFNVSSSNNPLTYMHTTSLRMLQHFIPLRVKALTIYGLLSLECQTNTQYSPILHVSNFDRNFVVEIDAYYVGFKISRLFQNQPFQDQKNQRFEWFKSEVFGKKQKVMSYFLMPNFEK